MHIRIVGVIRDGSGEAPAVRRRESVDVPVVRAAFRTVAGGVDLREEQKRIERLVFIVRERAEEPVERAGTRVVVGHDIHRAVLHGRLDGGDELMGKFVPVTITDATTWSLVGETKNE